VSYVSLKHGVNKADKRAAALFSSDLWEATRAVIDGATNENMGEIVYRINIDKDLSPDQKAAATEYAGRLLELRGFNLASAKQEKNGLDAAADASYVEGYNAVTEAQMKAASIAYDKAFEELSENFDEQSVNYMKEMPLETLIATMNDGLLGEEEMAILVNFVNAQERYNGMVQRVKDDIDEMIEESKGKEITEEREEMPKEKAPETAKAAPSAEEKVLQDKDSTLLRKCQEELPLIEKDFLTMYESMSEAEQRAWDLGEMFARVIRLRSEFI
jgi:hypothetical protein